MSPFPRGIAQGERRELENVATSQELGQKRRRVYCVLARDSRALAATLADTPRTFAQMAQDAADYARHAEAELQRANSALARLALVGADAVQPDLLADG